MKTIILTIAALAASTVSAAEPQRMRQSQNYKSVQRSDEEYDPFLGMKDENEAKNGQRQLNRVLHEHGSMSMSMSMSMGDDHDHDDHTGHDHGDETEEDASAMESGASTVATSAAAFVMAGAMLFV